MLIFVLFYLALSFTCSAGYVFAKFDPNDKEIKNGEPPPLGIAPLFGFAWPAWAICYFFIVMGHAFDKLEEWRNEK